MNHLLYAADILIMSKATFDSANGVKKVMQILESNSAVSIRMHIRNDSVCTQKTLLEFLD